MISVDTNILFFAFNTASPHHDRAREFLSSYAGSKNFALCELVLIEFYVLIRNPSVVTKPLSSQRAVEICNQFRSNPHWRIIDYPGGLMEEIWKIAGRPNFSRVAIFDARLALTLQHHGVTDFATHNVKHFKGSGFRRVWDPLNLGSG